jgi:5-methylcytosine-specific restriction endonuclease McrA
MLEIEKRLGRTLEEDYQEHYIKDEWGQKKIANRWRVPKGLIFFGNRRTNTPPWTERLGLPVRKQKQAVAPAVASQNRTGCEICGADRVIAQRAHWIAHKDGGSTQRFNIIRLCPNHHQLLDGGDPETTELARQILLSREAKRIIEAGTDSPEKQKELVRVSQAIITRRIS